MRVCGVRVCADGETIPGAYSSPTLFTTPKPPVVETAETNVTSVKVRSY